MKRNVMVVAIFLFAVGAARLAAQDHQYCWLKANGWLNSGTNPSVSEVKAEMQSLAAQFNVPWEVIAAVAY